MVFFHVFTRSTLLLLCSFSKGQTVFVLLVSSFKLWPEFRAHFMAWSWGILQLHVLLSTSFQSIIWVNTVLQILLTSLQLTCKWNELFYCWKSWLIDRPFFLVVLLFFYSVTWEGRTDMLEVRGTEKFER